MERLNTKIKLKTKTNKLTNYVQYTDARKNCYDLFIFIEKTTYVTFVSIYIYALNSLNQYWYNYYVKSFLKSYSIYVVQISI